MEISMGKIFFIVWAMILGTVWANADVRTPGTEAEAASRKASPRIVGGYEADKEDWPWMASLQDADESDFYDGHMCAGSLIHPRWVMTAAHCIEGDWSGYLEPDEIDVLLGVHDLENDIGERIHVKRIIRHPSYIGERDDWDSDIALLELASEASAYPTIPLVSRDTELEGKMAVVIGWGSISAYRDIYPETRQEVSVPIIFNDTCNASYSQQKPEIYDDPITENMLCAGYPQGGSDACSNDSGGPLVVQDNDTWKLAGIVSWGEGCAQPGFYGVYTRIAALADFVYTYVPLPNQAPVATDDHYTVSKGETIQIIAPGVLANDNDGDGDVLRAKLVDSVAHGSLTFGTDGSFTYVHDDSSDAASDHFTYQSSDDKLTSKVATVSIDITKSDDSEEKEDDDGGNSSCFISSLLY